MGHEIKLEIQRAAKSLLPQLIHLRREIHRKPELAFKEHATSALICKELEDHGIPYSKGVAGTGVVVEIQGPSAGPTILLRAELDALPIQEETDLPYGSEHEGLMHACGHDMHMASLLGCAFLLQEFRAQISGTVRLIFQPSEEVLPGGALAMIREGVLEDNQQVPAPSYCIAQHVLPSLPVGTLGFCSGTFMASADELYLKIIAEGGHAAKPECLSGDAVLAAAHVIVALQSVCSRNNPTTIPSVLSIGKVEANGATNVIPSSVELHGTFRTMDESWRESAHHRIRQIITNTAEAYGAKAHVDIRKGYPMLTNHETLTEFARDTACAYVGESNVQELPVWMASEDFAYFCQKSDGLFYGLGVGPCSDLHTSNFCPDESVLEIGSGYMVFLTLRVMETILQGNKLDRIF